MDKSYYELVKVINSEKLFKIKATRDIENIGIKKGELGGLVETDNLYDDAWVFPNSFVGKNCVVGEKSLIKNSRLDGKINVRGNCTIIGSSLNGNLSIIDKCQIINSTIIGSNGEISNNVHMDTVVCSGNFVINNNVSILSSMVNGNSYIVAKSDYESNIKYCDINGIFKAIGGFFLMDLELFGETIFKDGVEIVGNKNILTISNIKEGYKIFGNLTFTRDIRNNIVISSKVSEKALRAEEFKAAVKKKASDEKEYEKIEEFVNNTVKYVYNYFES